LAQQQQQQQQQPAARMAVIGVTFTSSITRSTVSITDAHFIVM
jgi:hypothetical protein